jgi:hypothetical protein
MRKFSLFKYKLVFLPINFRVLKTFSAESASWFFNTLNSADNV